MQDLYALADESNLADVEEVLINRFGVFIRSWPVEGVSLTNRKAPLMTEQELPDWNIGLHVENPRLTVSELEQLLNFLCDISRETNLPFVVGLTRRSWDPTYRDLCRVDRTIPDGALGSILDGLLAPS